MKKILYTPVKGRREGDPDTIWKLDLKKLGALLIPVISLLAWIILNCSRASSVPAIWQKIDRMDDRWEQRHEDLLYKLLDIKPKRQEKGG